MDRKNLMIILITFISVLLNLSIFEVDPELYNSLALVNRGLVTLNLMIYAVIFISLIDQFNQVKELTLGRKITKFRFKQKMIVEVLRLMLPTYIIQILVVIIFDSSQFKVSLEFGLNLFVIIMVISLLNRFIKLNIIYSCILAAIAIDSVTNFSLFLYNQSVVMVLLKFIIVIIGSYEMIEIGRKRDRNSKL